MGGANATVDSIQQGKGWQALLRAAVFFASVTGFISTLKNMVRNPGSVKAVSLTDDQWLSQIGEYDPKVGTTGVLVHEGGNRTFVSGYDGATQGMPKGIPGFDGNVISHVEAQAAWIMRKEGISEATLFINREPCNYPVRLRNGATQMRGCQIYLPKMLPTGAILHVVTHRSQQTFIGN